MTLPARLQRASLTAQLHQLVHETWRHPEMPRRLAVAVTFIDIPSNTLTQRHPKRLAHRGSPSNRSESRKSLKGNPESRQARHALERQVTKQFRRPPTALTTTKAPSRKNCTELKIGLDVCPPATPHIRTRLMQATKKPDPRRSG
jgi:hypothetical protein